MARRDGCFFIQARYDEQADGWTTVAVGAGRGVTLEYAADVYRSHRTPRRGVPRQIRVISERTLRAESGEDSVDRAYRDVGSEAERVGRRLVRA